MVYCIKLLDNCRLARCVGKVLKSRTSTKYITFFVTNIGCKRNNCDKYVVTDQNVQKKEIYNHLHGRLLGSDPLKKKIL